MYRVPVINMFFLQKHGDFWLNNSGDNLFFLDCKNQTYRMSVPNMLFLLKHGDFWLNNSGDNLFF